MEDIEIGEVGVDKLSDKTHEKAREHSARAPWLQWLALSTALFAVMAAIASLKSGQAANEALLQMNEATLKQAQAADAWSYYQAKGIKQVTRDAEVTILNALNMPADLIGAVRTELERNRSEQEESKQHATQLEQEQEELQHASHANLEHHHTFAYAVTTLQIAIGLSAIAALIERRWIWFVALVCGIAGIGFVTAGMISP